MLLYVVGYGWTKVSVKSKGKFNPSICYEYCMVPVVFILKKNALDLSYFSENENKRCQYLNYVKGKIKPQNCVNSSAGVRVIGLYGLTMVECDDISLSYKNVMLLFA